MLQNRTNKGGALLTALFIMTLVAIVATAMSTRLQVDIYKTRLSIINDRLYLASQFITFWTLSELNNKNKQFNQPNEFGMVAVLPRQLQTVYKQVQLRGSIYDLEGRYNLNNVVDKFAIQAFTNLQKQAMGNTTDIASKNLALAVNDWISVYDLNKGKDAYMAYYLKQKPPYYPSHLNMQSHSELRLVKDVSAQQYLALEPYIIALPEPTMININTASVPVLYTLGNGLNEAQVNELIAARGDKGINNVEKIAPLLKKLNIPIENIVIKSRYFLSVAEVRSEEFNLTVYTVYKRVIDQNKNIHTSIVRESINQF